MTKDIDRARIVAGGFVLMMAFIFALGGGQ
jgi:hypothetical protein